MEGHTGEQLSQSLLSFMRKHDIRIEDCRGQSYDNASNTSGRYNGMQSHIRELNPLAAYIPVSHTL